jgi:hypothetical protein
VTWDSVEKHAKVMTFSASKCVHNLLQTSILLGKLIATVGTKKNSAAPQSLRRPLRGAWPNNSLHNLLTTHPATLFHTIPAGWACKPKKDVIGVIGVCHMQTYVNKKVWRHMDLRAHIRNTGTSSDKIAFSGSLRHKRDASFAHCEARIWDVLQYACLCRRSDEMLWEHIAVLTPGVTELNWRVLIATCKQLVWSNRIARNMPIWVLCLILGSGPGAALPLEVTGSGGRSLFHTGLPGGPRSLYYLSYYYYLIYLFP